MKTEQQARELALRRSLLSDLVTLQMAESPCGSYQMQVATQVRGPLSQRPPQPSVKCPPSSAAGASSSAVGSTQSHGCLMSPVCRGFLSHWPPFERRWLLQVLASLSGRAHAMKKHLEVHTDQLRKSVNQLLKPQNAGWAFTVS